jgi:hypothetical protein
MTAQSTRASAVAIQLIKGGISETVSATNLSQSVFTGPANAFLGFAASVKKSICE